VAEVKLIREGQDCADVRRAVYLRAIGKDKRGRLRRKSHVPISLLARGLGCDRKTIRDWHRQNGITSSQGKRGRPKKSQP
jgi:DNA-binding transcriptional regulator YiaG